ncbi:GHMP family kinase ATP-binding protein [Blattabacterium cuenoti]|uniref:GHMP family kinase ATP-binding protein n=1 Tax=Blattabacterium cuenoti TaxID=1653831 RepID=UPI00163CBEAF|nr:mevalonate kinase [Blattabacterium cuenoti]
MKESFFPAKILLFGEYGILENSSGLSIPHNLYKGTLKLNSKFNFNKEIVRSNYEIRKYYSFLEKNFLTKLNIRKLHQDIEKGLFFHSNIPQKYGIGSSGALVAAIYDKYAKKCVKNIFKSFFKKKDIIVLKKIFSKMESFFHGKSSGIDPLICYLNIPILIRSKTDIFTIKLPKKKNGKGAIFLLDSGIQKDTFSVIRIFFEKLKNDNFKKILTEEFIKYNEKCIKYFLKEDFKKLLKNVKKLSIWVFHHFRPMIPKNIWKIWEEGIFHNAHYLKLCGSGGGGFILGFTSNYDLSRKKLEKYLIKVLFRF